ncbi:hypothetical protein OS493_012613 [Desmophyllum pertusum]|uniref:Uncharacterized protein n=1 Tax=Desmophyllum pertusum TaxID=174260 RepID=A0A9W9ZDS8_9CNID|nr:hypothetical protein OS493_012613 [Desmophyllum pertusum]
MQTVDIQCMYNVSGECEEQQSGILLADSAASDSDEERKRKEKEREREKEKEDEKKRIQNNLLNTIKRGNFEEIENTITPRALQKMLLRYLAIEYEDRKGPDEERVNQLANSVEGLTYCLLDPLRSDKGQRELFGEHYLDHIVDEAIDLDQKKFFTHPVVHDEMNRKWHDRAECMKRTWRSRDFKKSELGSWLQLLLFRVWCIFDLVFSLILFSVFSLLKKRSPSSERGRGDESHEKSHITVAEMYLIYLETPYFKFVRDTLSYILLVVLHYALCLSPSTIAFSGLDDCWNMLDFVSLLVYLIIFTLRLATVMVSGSEKNNRALAIAGYLYSFNTLCLTLRAFGYAMERSRDVGTIQIALFSILIDIRIVFWQFTAAILAFSIAITKVYMAEKSFIANGRDEK